MKTLKYIFSTILIITLVWSCEENVFGDTDFLESTKAPTNLSAAVSVSQDNSGAVTITPLGEGVASYSIDLGDGSDIEEGITPGNSVEHVYEEGTYDATITAASVNGLTTSITQPIVVSFKAPENLVVTIENDAAISKQVNVSATADFALSFEAYFGEPGNDEPVPFNIDETISYQYAEAGTYTIRVVAMSAAIATTEYTVDFDVTAILQPLEAAPAPIRAQADVISIYSDSYTNPDPIDYNPNWGQSTTYTQIQVDGNNMIQYGDITYQGIDFSSVAVDASAMEYIHVDVWTAQADFNAKISPISAGPNETAYDLELTQDQWTSFDIPLSAFTDQNPLVDFSNIIQFKFEGAPSEGGTIFIDNLYFYKVPTAVDTGIVGTWKLSPTAGALGVGPSVGDISWWNCDDTCVSDRACYYDDAYVFNQDGSFQNVLGTDTWVEPWQGGSDACGAPVAPHDGSNAATYVYDENAGTVTLNGVGAFIGLPKATNTGELTSPGDAPASVTYNVTFVDPNTLSVYIETGAGVFWQYTLVRDGVVSSPLTGTWQMAQEAGSLGVGPALGDISWWNCDDACVSGRACYYDDAYVFGADGSFQNVLGTDTWVEPWQGGSDACGAPVAPHDGSNPATFTYDSGILTLNGVGAYIGLPKATNTGELSSPGDAPASVAYNVSFIDNNTISVSIEAGAGVFWQYKLVRI
ncbi:hypothetical protein [Hwangdonia lutea]|uniref:PKD/Chitinase domain-containing protein n=1 Tax=Hwangdonia lutea TaxID=3075823 RepID=A0AA97EJW7_9FLAO|nr:hypothetical protein [Hwangdonia sp. SCSIO 19198]WOD42789.1 hypothetical protein RNZ46_12400 [Hwangdonia sp. SCSIO 19198]